MKKRWIAAVLCLCLCLSCLVGCSSGGGAGSYATGSSTLTGDWEQNKFTDCVPTPMAGKVTTTQTEDTRCVVGMEMSMDEFVAYVEALKDSGFTKEKQEEDQRAQSIYVYSAKNKDGVKASVGFIGGVVAIEIVME